jgi:hypothetical protein
MVEERKSPEVNGLADVYALRRKAERGVVPCDEGFRKQYPSLFSVLTNNRLDDKHWTEPARLSLQNDHGDWAVGLAAPGLGGFTSVLAPTLEAGLALLDEGLCLGTLHWRFNLKRSGKARKDPDSEK